MEQVIVTIALILLYFIIVNLFKLQPRTKLVISFMLILASLVFLFFSFYTR